jgi:hypothetical protein
VYSGISEIEAIAEPQPHPEPPILGEHILDFHCERHAGRAQLVRAQPDPIEDDYPGLDYNGRNHSMVSKHNFVEAVNELRGLLSASEVPREVVNRALRLVERMHKCLVVVPQSDITPATMQPSVRPKPSDVFVRVLAAARASDWPLILVLIHDAFLP